MSKLTTWVKPNGTEIDLNNATATIALAKANGWKIASDEPTAIKDMKADALKEMCKEAGIEYEGKDKAIDALEKIETDKQS